MSTFYDNNTDFVACTINYYSQKTIKLQIWYHGMNGILPITRVGDTSFSMTCTTLVNNSCESMLKTANLIILYNVVVATCYTVMLIQYGQHVTVLVVAYL